MDNNFNETMDKIQRMLQDEKMAENIKALFDALTNNNSKNSLSENKTNTLKENNSTDPIPVKRAEAVNTSNNKAEIDEQINTVIKIKKIYDRITNDNDPRINLLNALKPYLNSVRQNKVENAIKIVQLSKLTRIANELDEIY